MRSGSVSFSSRYTLRRIFTAVLVLVGMSLITFVLVNVIPADPIKYAAGPNANAEIVANMRREWGMDRPLPEQYVRYVIRLVHGDLGVSIMSRRPVLDDLRDYFPATLELAIVAFLLTLLIGVSLGLFSAARGGGTDTIVPLAGVFGGAIPIFWLGIMLQLVFYLRLGWLPAGGRLGQDQVDALRVITGSMLLDAILQRQWPILFDALKHLVLPAIALSLGPIAIIARIARASAREIFGQDFVRTAQAKGLSPRRVLWVHVLKPASIPILTTLGSQFGYMLSGSFLVETIFQWPGIGRYTILAITAVDFPAIMGATLLVSVTFLTVNFLVDMLYVWVDPRIKY
jgi:peptide/nickel transport system permease protein